MTSFKLIKEDIFWQEELIVTGSYLSKGVYYEGETTELTYKEILGTLEPYKDGQSGMHLPSGVSSTDANTLFTSTPLLTYDDTGDLTLADKVYLRDPLNKRSPPQRYIVMDKENWTTNSGFKLIQTDDAISYLIVKEEKVVNNGS